MFSVEQILQNVWLFAKNTLIATAIICITAKMISYTFNIQPAYTFGAVTTLFVIMAIGTLYTPLFTDYKEYVKSMQQNMQQLQADLQILKANESEMLSDIDALKAIIEEKKQQISSLQKEREQTDQEKSRIIAALQAKVASVQQKYDELEQHATNAGEVHRQVLQQLNELKGMEKFLFLKTIGISPAQVANAITKVVAGMQNGKTEHEKAAMQKALELAKKEYQEIYL